MKDFNYYQPTEIRFGCGRVKEVGEVVAKYGKRCLLVTVPVFPAIEPAVEKIKVSLKDAGIEFAHFDGVIPNPTTESITAGTRIARAHRADVVLGVGGGSSMDTAKAIAVEVTHEGTCWDYIWSSEKQPTLKTLPIVAVSTTSGTGSQVTQVAVVTNPSIKYKSAIFNSIIYPRTAIVDPELMLTVPEHITASTGFDAFTHAFESYLHCNASPYTNMLAKEAINLVARYLPRAVKNGRDKEARIAMAWADTLGGLSIANAGVTLPHGIGMAMGGIYPWVMHGEALAVMYPAFTRYTYPSAVEQFATVGRILNKDLEEESNEVAAKKSCDEIDRFLKEIGMWLSLKGLKIPEDELPKLSEASLVLPDYKNNPRVATEEEVLELLKKSYQR